MQEVKKAIILTAGLGTRFLPLSKILPKHLFPLLDKPLFQYLVEEAVGSGIREIIFVVSPNDKSISNYFRPNPKLENYLKKKEKEEYLKKLQDLYRAFEGVNFRYVVQKKPLGDGQAILCAQNLVKNEPVAVLFVDDIVVGEDFCLSQLLKNFSACQCPVIALFEIETQKLSSYGVVRVEKISNRLFKIKEIIEKPKPQEAPSNLAIVGKYILTPEVFEYLSKAKPSFEKEIILAETFKKMIEDGKTIYGYQFKGQWLECGDIQKWIVSFLTIAQEKFKK